MKWAGSCLHQAKTVLVNVDVNVHVHEHEHVHEHGAASARDWERIGCECDDEKKGEYHA